ncbi:toxin-antitoxin system YwqK family antitoxin [Pedobacter sp.]|uniref:toxin-antitoxin system YwqK family antitoxin n=1 Tax=Pedobacter sp. TaxID=1411316 RepID=UPI00396CAF28
MRVFSVIFLFSILSALTVNAQSYRQPLDIAAYRHYIAYEDHKVAFYTQPSDKNLRKLYPLSNYYWFSNGQIRSTQGGYSGKLIHGLYSDYYLNNQLKEQGYFNMGLKEGEWKSWNEAGSLKTRVNYRKGEANGTFYRYNTAGLLIEEGTYANGKINGKLKKYIRPDSVKVERYKNGIIAPQEENNKQGWLKRLFRKNKA